MGGWPCRQPPTNRMTPEQFYNLPDIPTRQPAEPWPSYCLRRRYEACAAMTRREAMQREYARMIRQRRTSDTPGA